MVPNYRTVHVSSSGDSEICGLMAAKDAKLALVVSSSAAAIGSVSALTAVVIAMAIVLKGHASRAYRITLYLAVLNLLETTMVGLELLPVNFHGLGNSVSLRNQSGWEETCSAIGFLATYLGYRSRWPCYGCACISGVGRE